MHTQHLKTQLSLTLPVLVQYFYGFRRGILREQQLGRVKKWTANTRPFLLRYSSSLASAGQSVRFWLGHSVQQTTFNFLLPFAGALQILHRWRPFAWQQQHRATMAATETKQG